MSSAELDRDRNRDRYGLNRPDPVEHRDGGGGFVTTYGSATYGNGRYSPASGYGNRDRISVGRFCRLWTLNRQNIECEKFKNMVE